MITVKQAVESVIEYMRDFSQYMPNSDQRLEEVDFDDNGDEWRVIVSFKENSLSPGPRIYKQFRVNSDKAEVTSMRNCNETPF
jgi:hypothetical protein